MDPYLEAHWHDVHPNLLVSIRNQIAEQLPDDLVVRIEQSIKLGEDATSAKRSDVDVSNWGDTSNWQEDWNPQYEVHDPGGDDVTITEPAVLTELEPPHRYLEIHSVKSGRSIVTIIEVLSPANKRSGKDNRDYLEKRNSYLNARLNFVEIDLIRQGSPMITMEEDPAQTRPTIFM